VELLLDTHALLWWLTDSKRLPARWRQLIGDPEHRVLVSAVCVWEIAIKSSIGRLQVKMPPDFQLSRVATECGFEDLAITAAHAAEVTDLPTHHADPFDRLLIAQAAVERLTIVTADRQFRNYDVPLLD